MSYVHNISAATFVMCALWLLTRTLFRRVPWWRDWTLINTDMVAVLAGSLSLVVWVGVSTWFSTWH